jgi:hypothetical protein
MNGEKSPTGAAPNRKAHAPGVSSVREGRENTSAFLALDPPRRHNTTNNSITYADCCRATCFGCPISQTWTSHRQDNLSASGATVSSSAVCTKKARSKTDSPIPASTSVDRLVATTVGGSNNLGRKNRAKAGETNGASDDSKNDGACCGNVLVDVQYPLRGRYRG